MLDAQVVQVEDELMVVSGPRAAERHFAGERAQAEPLVRFVDAARRHENRERGRLQPLHRLCQEDQAVRKSMREYRSGHGVFLPTSRRARRPYRPS